MCRYPPSEGLQQVVGLLNQPPTSLQEEGL